MPRTLRAAVLAIVALAGCGSSSQTRTQSNPFGDSLTPQQYTALRRGQDEQMIVDRLQQTGRPENLVAPRFTKLFPRHDPSAVSCSFWQISGDSRLLVRLCFSSPAGRLIQKLERRA